MLLTVLTVLVLSLSELISTSCSRGGKSPDTVEGE